MACRGNRHTVAVVSLMMLLRRRQRRRGWLLRWSAGVHLRCRLTALLLLHLRRLLRLLRAIVRLAAWLP